MNNYRVMFIKKNEKDRKEDQYLGTVEVNDHGVGPSLTLTAKAYRQAPDRCFAADLVRIEQIRTTPKVIK